MGDQLPLPHTDRPPVGARTTVDVAAARVACDRCREAFASRELNELLRWSRQHVCPTREVAR